MKPYLFLLLTLVAALGYSQSNSEVEVFKKVIGHTIVIEKKRMYIQCHKSKAFFNLNAFKRMTPLEIPTTVLKEMDSNAMQSCSGIWDSKLLLNNNFGNWVYGEKCLTKGEVQILIEKKASPLMVLSISNPVFDDDEENCVVSITILRSGRGSSGQSYFLKKVYGVWVIVDTYNIWMS